MKYAVVTFSSGRPWLAEVFNGPKAAYCHKQGYDWIFVDKPVVPERHPSWEKLEAVRAALETHDAVMWIDDDATVSNPEIRFESLLDEGIFLALCRDYAFINTGVWVIRNCPAAFALLDVWRCNLMYEKYKDCEVWEQGAFQEIYGKGREGIKVYPSEVMNSFEPHFRPSDREKFRPWMPGDFVYHFSGPGSHVIENEAWIKARVGETCPQAGRMSYGVQVVVSGAGCMMPAWCTAWRRSGNVLPVHFYNDGSWTPEEVSVCESVGTVHPLREVYAEIAKKMPGARAKKVGWMAKQQVMMQATSEWAVWLDHDVEVQGRLEPMVDYAMANAEWFASPVYSSFCDRYAETRVAQHGVIVYRPAHEKMRRWAEYAINQVDPNDEHNFATCFGGVEKARAECLDLYRPEWYDTPDRVKFRHLRDTAPMLAASTAATVHWASGELKGPMREHVAVLGADAPRRPASGRFPLPKGAGVMERDAVFVLGTGSRFNNAELRFALRSMAKYCPWVRQVWVVGADPGFLNAGTVKYIPAADVHTHCKDANLIHKIEAACLAPGMAEEFLICSDDQLVTYSSGWEDFRPRFVRRWREADSGWYEGEAWKRNLRETLRRFGDGAYYLQPHIWTPVKKSLFLDMLKMCNYKVEKSCTIFSLYGNFALQHGAEAPVENFEHDFSVDGAWRPVRHVAYNDGAFGKPEFRDRLSELFPAVCKYERGT